MRMVILDFTEKQCQYYGCCWDSGSTPNCFHTHDDYLGDNQFSSVDYVTFCPFEKINGSQQRVCLYCFQLDLTVEEEETATIIRQTLTVNIFSGVQNLY